MESKHNLGPILFACRAGAHGHTGKAGDRGLTLGWVVAWVLSLVLIMAVLAVLGSIGWRPRILGESARFIYLCLVLGVLPIFLSFHLTGLPKCEFRERGVRWWSWFRGWRELRVNADTVVTLRHGDMSGHGSSRRLILGADPGDSRTFMFRAFRERDREPLEKVAVHYSLPRADQKLESVRAGQGTLWIRGIRLDPDGLRFRPGPKEERMLIPYEQINRIDVKEGRFRIEVGDDADPAVIEGDAYQPNFLAGRIALEELLA